MGLDGGGGEDSLIENLWAKLRGAPLFVELLRPD